MSSHTDKDFSSSYGSFYVSPGRVERVDGTSLRSMFLPRVTAEGLKRLGDSDEFVLGQMKHYGVEFDEKEISGNGTFLLRKVLRAGKCDRVPDHLVTLRRKLHTEWLNSLSPEQLLREPEWVMQRYFLSGLRRDPTKTTTVVAIPLPPRTAYRASQMKAAASSVTGLHLATGRGPKTRTIYMGWDLVAVSKAAEDHATKEKKENQDGAKHREDECAKLHSYYLYSIGREGGSKTYSPVGRYIIDCEELEAEGDLTLNIRQTNKCNVFEASFDFGMIEGIMIISANKTTLEEYCLKLDLDEEDEGDDEESCEKRVASNKMQEPTSLSKREEGAAAIWGRVGLPKTPKIEPTRPRTCLLRLKCRETGEGIIDSKVHEGMITFKDNTLVAFRGKANLPWVGDAIPFKARKVSDKPSGSSTSWADYSESAYESARVNRWYQGIRDMYTY